MSTSEHIQSSIYGTWEWDTTTSDIVCSDGIFNIYDIPVTNGKSLSKDSFFQYVEPETSFFCEQLTRAKKLGETAFEYYLTTKQGSVKKINGFISSEPEGSGEIRFIRGTFLDVTKLVRQSNDHSQVTHSHEHTESLAKMASWQWNPGQNLFTLSSNFFKLLGLDFDGFDITYTNFLTLVHIEDRHKLPPVVNKDIPDINPTSAEIRMLKKGSVLHIKSIHRLERNEEGEMVITGTLQDITEEVSFRRELEEKKLFAEMLFDKSVDLISAYDTNYKIIAWNKTCEERYKINKEDALGKDLLQLYPELVDDPWLQDLSMALKGEYIFRTNQTSRSLEGYFDNYLLPLINDDGEILGVLSISHDLTEMRQVAKRLDDLNHSLEEKNEELERSNKELASFSYVASHDLQEPLRKIQTFSQRIIETETGNISSQGKDYLKRMEAAAKRMQTLIEDLLTFSRTNTALKNLESVDLNKMVEEVKTAHKDAIEEKNAIVEAGDLPVVRVISFQFRQLLENLFSNALKYSRSAERPHIKIQAELFTGVQIKMHGVNINKNYFKITVADNGIGFEQQYAEKIFELFQRLHGKHEYPGTGLGLSICKKVIQNHHGFISATGEPGKGATFTIYLPE